MSNLPTPILAAIHKALSDNPEARPDDFLASLEALISNDATRRKVHDAWLTTRLQIADQEGGELSEQDVFGPLIDELEKAAGSNISK